MPTRTTDRIEALKKRDPEAFRQCYLEYKGKIFSYLRFWIGHKETAEDLLQDTFRSFWNACEGLQPDSNLQGYLLFIARNKALDYRKRNKPQTGLQSDWEPGVLLADELVKEERYQAVLNAFGKLPAEQQEVLHLKVYNEMTFDRIAEILEIPTPTVKSRYRYGLDKLRTLIRKQ